MKRIKRPVSFVTRGQLRAKMKHRIKKDHKLQWEKDWEVETGNKVIVKEIDYRLNRKENETS